MPAKVKVRILAGRNLPVMDKSSDASDAFVEVKLGNTTYKTEVYRRSLNPFWNSEWFRFEVSDQELQDEPLQIRIMDYDTYSANDAIGKVYINLNPLLLNPGRSMSGWLPIYDTLHGIRGEINCMVKVNLFADNNRYRNSSCGVRFFFSDIPNGYKCDAILGFVDELLVNDDPEYQWIDKIRTPRASNEARQTLFTKLSGEVQRKLGLKAEIFGGNAVIGYQQSFDLEGGSGIVGRGIGTAVVLSKIGSPYDGIISPEHGSLGLLDQFHNIHCRGNNSQLSNSQSYERTLLEQEFDKRAGGSRTKQRLLVHSISAEQTKQAKQLQPNPSVASDTSRTINDNHLVREQSNFQREFDTGRHSNATSVPGSSSSNSQQLQQQYYQSSSETIKSLTQHTSSLSTPVQPPHQQTASTSGSSGNQSKRRRDKSQSASIDDALSIIEEKLDDFQNQPEAPNSSNLQETAPRVGSSVDSAPVAQKTRQMVRAKEIDLQDELETHPKLGNRALTMSVVDQDMSPSAAPLESSHSSSTATTSASQLTMDTIRAVVEPQARFKLLATTSSSQTGEQSGPHTLRRSHTDLSSHSDVVDGNLMPCSESRDQNQDPRQHKLVSRSVSPQNCLESLLAKRASPSANLRNQASETSQQTSAFVQTVRAIKAEQKLLQTLVKQQNQFLDVNLNNRRDNSIYPNRVHQSEYPFVTLKKFPDRIVQCTGGVVSVHSVKLLDHIINDEESETRDIWWTEIRKEIRSHAKALNCNTIIGYGETSIVIGDVCILSACGTAAILRNPSDDPKSTNSNQSLKARRSTDSPSSGVPAAARDRAEQETASPETGDCRVEQIDCSFGHSSLSCVDSIQTMAFCTVCKSTKVSDVLLLTIEPPCNLNIVSGETLIQARVCRAKRDSHGEASAKEIGDALPFLEFELHRQLFSKLKFKGMNCIFNLNIVISVGENMITGVATGTACFVLGLPAPSPPQISAGKGIKTSKLNEIQRLIAMCSAKNREKLGLSQIQAKLDLYHRQLNATSPLGDNSTPAPETGQQSVETSNLHVPSTSAAYFEQENGSSLGETVRHHGGNRHRKAREHRASIKRRGQHKSARDDNWPQENPINLIDDDSNIVLEVDDNEDADIIALLIDSDIPDGYLVCNSESLPSVQQSSVTSINMFTQVIRSKLIASDQFAQQFDWIMQALFVKLRRSLPCCLTNLNFVVDLPEANIVQISVTGCLLGLGNTSRSETTIDINLASTDADVASESLVNSASLERASGKNKLDGKQPSILPKSIFSSTSANSTFGSSSSSASPTSSSVSTLRSSSNSTSTSSMKSVKDCSTNLANKGGDSSASQAAAQPTQPPAPMTKTLESIQMKAGGQVKALTKKLSNSNIAALLTGGRSKRSSAIQEPLELELRPKIKEEVTTRETIEAVKQEIQQNRLGQRANQGQSFRPVFKKQQTYPGAISPAISGQDKLIVSSTNAQGQHEQHAGTSGLNAATRRRATILLNKVKLPLKDLSSNFNNNNSALATSSSKGVTNADSVNSSSSTKFMQTNPSDHFGHSISGLSHMISMSPNLGARQLQPMSSVPISSSSINSSIDITSLSYIPGAKDYHYMGNLSFSFVRETNSVRENGGLNGFIHCFLMEVYAIVRAHVSALGGNAFLSFRLQQSCIFYHSNKNQAQCLISVAGDAVQVSL